VMDSESSSVQPVLDPDADHRLNMGVTFDDVDSGETATVEISTTFGSIDLSTIDQPGLFISPPSGISPEGGRVTIDGDIAAVQAAIESFTVSLPFTFGDDDMLAEVPKMAVSVRVNDFAAVGTAPMSATSSFALYATCGDGVIQVEEACDDGNVANGDGCNSSCLVEPNRVCTGEPSVCVVACGDGTVQREWGEACDDGNDFDGDGCSACQMDDGMFCTGSPSVCQPWCKAAHRVAQHVTFPKLFLQSGIHLDSTTAVAVLPCTPAEANQIVYDGAASKELYICNGSTWLQLLSQPL